MAEADPPGAAPREEGGGVHQHEAGEPIRPGRGGAHADRPAPVVGHQRDVLQPQLIHHPHHVVDPLLQAVAVGPRVRLVGQAAADVVGHDQAVPATQGEDHLAPVERPGRIPVEQQERRPLPFVQIMAAMPAERNPMRLEGIERAPIVAAGMSQFPRVFRM